MDLRARKKLKKITVFQKDGFTLDTAIVLTMFTPSVNIFCNLVYKHC